MRVAIVSRPPDLAPYVAEILQTWGLALHEVIPAEALHALDPDKAPVAILRAGPLPTQAEEALQSYVRRGGTLICFVPTGALAQAAALVEQAPKETPLRLRLSERPAAGTDGELLPIVGRALTYQAAEGAAVLAHLSHPGRHHGESPGITETPLGRGRILVFAFDLPLAVLLLRQGDPERAEVIPPGDGCARPCHMAADSGPSESAWLPHADLLARLLADTVRRCLPLPSPMLWHLPHGAAGLLLYSGDEDGAETAWNDAELEYLANMGARMSLYIIPIGTSSTRADVERYRAHHDVGPHPNLRPLDGRPIPERLAELERQILLFQEMYGFAPRTLRNHCLAWAGYLEPAEVMARLGVRMDTNYVCTPYLRDRNPAPYALFGAAMPMRFCHPDGRIVDCFQQPTHVSDDVLFGPADYSYRLSPAHYDAMLHRIFSDITTRFHTPYCVCIHPSNWVRFSRPQGQALLRHAARRHMPVWSVDQWCAFWQTRSTWAIRGLTWNNRELDFVVHGAGPCDGLTVLLPVAAEGNTLAEVHLDGFGVAWRRETRYREEVALVTLPPGASAAHVRATYREDAL